MPPIVNRLTFVYVAPVEAVFRIYHGDPGDTMGCFLLEGMIVRFEEGMV